MGDFWKSILDKDNPSSSRRLITLIISGLFIVTCFTILFTCFYVIFYTPKGKVDKDLLGVLIQVLKYEFYIILSGLSFITVGDMGKAAVEMAKVKLSGKQEDEEEPSIKDEPK